jgi:menaquinone-dependent protoporphyrinogen IX oxidase
MHPIPVLMKIWIVYDSKYGNNKQIAEALGGLFNEGNVVHVHHAKDITPKEAIEDQPDILLFGGPLRAGMISFTIKGWASKFAHLLKSKKLKLQKVAVWGTHARNDPETPPKFSWANVEPKWKAAMDEVPAEKAMPGVQGINIDGMEGPMEANWKELITSFAGQIKAL